jgi:hypothetical protein
MKGVVRFDRHDVVFGGEGGEDRVYGFGIVPFGVGVGKKARRSAAVRRAANVVRQRDLESSNLGRSLPDEL